MPDHAPSLEHRFEELSSEVAQLRTRVAELTRQVAALARTGAEAPGEFPAAVLASNASEAHLPEAEGAVNAASLLSSVAAVSFLLVIALVLRMLADHAIVERHIGVMLGLAYSLVLMAYGLYRHAQSRHVLPVYALSGVLLFYSIIYEASTRFALLSPSLAYGLLLFGMALMTFLSWRYHVALPLYFGVLGAAAMGISLGFPYPSYPHLGFLLLFATGAAYAGILVPRGRAVFWPVLLLSLMYWGLWVVRLRVQNTRGAASGEDLATAWFLPLLCLFAAAYILLVLWSVGHETWRFPLLEGALPVINVAWAYPAAHAAVAAWGGPERRVAAVGAALAAVHLLLALFVARQKGKEQRPTTTFTIAAFLLLAIALPGAMGNMRLTLLSWTLAAFAIAVLSWVRVNRLARLMAYCFQVFAYGTALESAALSVESALAWEKIATAGLLAALCLAHYIWCRRRAAQPETPLFHAAAVALLAAGIAYGFQLARLLLFAAQHASAPENAALYQCGQSVLITGGAIVILLLALRWKNGELLATGFLAALLGGVKVFGYDLAHLTDLPLLLSLSMFGITAAASSLVWRRWQRLENAPPEEVEQDIGGPALST